MCQSDRRCKATQWTSGLHCHFTTKFCLEQGFVCSFHVLSMSMWFFLWFLQFPPSVWKYARFGQLEILKLCHGVKLSEWCACVPCNGLVTCQECNPCLQLTVCPSLDRLQQTSTISLRYKLGKIIDRWMDGLCFRCRFLSEELLCRELQT